MSSLVSISNPDHSTAADVRSLSAHRVSELPVVVLSPHNQCNCRCVMCDIWRIRQPQQISPAELEALLHAFREFGTRWVVFTGGEPQLNPQLFSLARMLKAEGIRVTLLTAGLLLEAQAEETAQAIDDIIVSLDGPPPLHDQIRRVPGAFDRITSGIRVLRRFRPDMQIRARCTVQRANHASLCATVKSAREIGLNSISFLGADVSSPAFNHPQGWQPDRRDKVVLNAIEVDALSREVEELIRSHAADLAAGFIVESPAKLRRIVAHFQAHLGQGSHVAPRCNAPWVSAVIEASGDVRPCFFHPVIGNIRAATLQQIVNGPQALQFRSSLDVERDPVCRRCVCSLHIPRQSGERKAPEIRLPL